MFYQYWVFLVYLILLVSGFFIADISPRAGDIGAVFHGGNSWGGCYHRLFLVSGGLFCCVIFCFGGGWRECLCFLFLLVWFLCFLCDTRVSWVVLPYSYVSCLCYFFCFYVFGWIYCEVCCYVCSC